MEYVIYLSFTQSAKYGPSKLVIKMVRILRHFCSSVILAVFEMFFSIYHMLVHSEILKKPWVLAPPKFGGLV